MGSPPPDPPRPPWLADQTLRVVQLVFPVVIATSLTTYRDVVANPLSDVHRIAALALLAVYLTAVLSWMGWHATMERYPYVYRNDDGSLNLSEQFRVFSDLAVVILYAYVLFNIDPLKTVPSSDINGMLLGYPLIFIFYLVSGKLRIMEYDRRASRIIPLVVGLIGFCLLVAIYYVARRSLSTAAHASLNATLLFGVIALTIGYRIFTEWYRARRQSLTSRRNP